MARTSMSGKKSATGRTITPAREAAGRKRPSRARAGARAAAIAPPAYAPMDAVHMAALRDVFWNNVVRDMLNGLAVLSQQQPDLFDGRFGLLTRNGERIPIGQITPLFACSIPGSAEERDASAAVQCTVFRIQTPEGEVFTLPVQEIRAMHTMTPELVDKLQKVAEDEAEKDEDGEPKPFGFAAYQSLPKLPIQPAPEEPGE